MLRTLLSRVAARPATAALAAATATFTTSLGVAHAAGDSTAGTLNPDAWAPFTLVRKTRESHDTVRLTYALADARAPASLPVASCLMARLPCGEGGKFVQKPYTPVDAPGAKGELTLVVKAYPTGALSPALAALEPGSTTELKGPFPKIEYKAGKWSHGETRRGERERERERVLISTCSRARAWVEVEEVSRPASLAPLSGTPSTHAARPSAPHTRPASSLTHPFSLSFSLFLLSVGMVAGGTGITPMLQVLHAGLDNPADKTKFTLVYGSWSPADVICRAEVEALAAAHKDRLSVHYLVDAATPAAADVIPGQGNVKVGRPDKALLKAVMPPPGTGVCVMVCGPGPMMTAVIGNKQKVEGGPPAQGPITGALGELGYTNETAFKF